MRFDGIIERLKSSGVSFAAGLSEADFEYVRRQYGISFPPDVRDFYATATPTSGHFWNWSDRSAANISKIKEIMEWPIDGMVFDIEHDQFWLRSWKPRPANKDQAIAYARQQYAQAPRLIPIFGHRFIPMEPSEPGNPVFSVYQTTSSTTGKTLRPISRSSFISRDGKR